MKRAASILLGSLVLVGSGSAWASVQSDLQQAHAAGRAVFLIVTDGGAKDVDVARKVATDAQRLVPGAAVLELNRADPANEALVKSYRLATVPVPLILVVASNGVVVTGAKPSAVTGEALARAIPTAAKAEHLKARAEGKATFVVFARADMASRGRTLDACRAAVATLQGKAAVVSVDVADGREKAFLEEMKVDAAGAEPVTHVFNAKGQATATYVGAVDAAALAEAARKEVSGGCNCGPGGCK